MIVINVNKEAISELKKELDSEIGINSDLGTITHAYSDYNSGCYQYFGFVGTSVAVDINNTMIGVITSLYVKPEYRGHGFASKLIETAVQQFYDFGISRVQIEADSESIAAKLYNYVGFKPKLIMMEGDTRDILRNYKERE